jgi:hypothetical protein
VVQVLGRDGSLVGEYEALADPLWLDEDEFIGYRLDWQQDESGEWFAATGPNGERLGTVLMGNLGSEELTEVDVPLGPALSSGTNQLAITRFDAAGLPETAVWGDGFLTEWLPGAPLAWSAGTDHLVLVVPRRSGPSIEGSLNVVEWPSMRSDWSSAPDLAVSTAAFDATGTYLAYPEFVPRPRVPRQVPEFDLIVNVVDIGADTISPVQAPENGEFAWLAHDRLIVVGFDSYHASVLDLGGEVLAQESVVGPNVITSESGLTAVFYDAELDQPPMQILTADELRELQSPGILAGPAPALAPDDSGVLVVARQSGGENTPATVLIHLL